MHLCAELIAVSMMLEPLGEVGANFSLQLSSQSQFTKINNKKVIAENQCEKHKNSSLAYKSSKCNTLCQCGVITDPPHYIYTQHGVFFVAHRTIIIRTSKISPCLSHIFLILTGVSRDRRKITATRKHLTISFGALRNRYKTDKTAFFNFKNIHLSSN